MQNSILYLVLILDTQYNTPIFYLVPAKLVRFDGDLRETMCKIPRKSNFKFKVSKEISFQYAREKKILRLRRNYSIFLQKYT